MIYNKQKKLNMFKNKLNPRFTQNPDNDKNNHFVNNYTLAPLQNTEKKIIIIKIINLIPAHNSENKKKYLL